MLDNQLFALIISIINVQKTTAGISTLLVKQAFQPTQQGVNTLPTAYLYKIGDKRIGYPYEKNVWNAMSSTMELTTLQQYETTFQISALATQNPATPSAYTASDILNSVAYILQNGLTIATLENQGVGIKNVMDVRNPYFTDDRERFEASPSFDFTLTHKQIIVSTSPIIENVEFQINMV